MFVNSTQYKTEVRAKSHAYDNAIPRHIPAINSDPSNWTQPSPLFYQGEDFIFDALLALDGSPTLVADWNISAIVKRDKWSVETIWSGAIGTGITALTNPGTYEIWIPSTVFASLFAGTYWLDIFATSTASPVRTLSITTVPFVVEYGIFSSHPESKQTSVNVLNPKDLLPTFPIQPSTSVPEQSSDDDGVYQ